MKSEGNIISFGVLVDSKGNFVTEFNYIEQRNNIGSNHIISNKTTYEIDNNNSLLFTTRRNKEISLTEYYDFIYQYKNDCLTAGIKYNKTFYQDNDFEPEENLFFTSSNKGKHLFTPIAFKLDKNICVLDGLIRFI